ncbi:unnamed protein product [Peniophora sp. CBMAI 1063]|nr:unnamed protein product [Peniophora sp. CBMAI 1063]
MSLQGLMSGADCAVEINPLHQVLKHTEGDRGVQQDRIAGPSGSRQLHHLPTTSAPGASSQDMAMARQFFDQSGPSTSMQQPMHMNGDMARQLQLMSAARGAVPDFSDAWSEIARRQDGTTAPRAGMPSMAWAGEFDASNGQAIQPITHQHNQSAAQPGQQSQFMPRSMYGNSSFGMYGGMGMGGMGMAPQYMQQPQFAPVQDKGKGKLKESDFDAAFAQVTASLQPQQQSRIEEVTNELAETSLEDKTGLEGSGAFKEVWEQMQNSDMPPPKEDLAKWEAEFNQLMRSDNEEPDYDYGNMMKEIWEQGLNQSPESMEPQYDEQGVPALSTYVFEQQNPYLDPSSSRSCLEDAKGLLARGGSLTEAALLLEAAIQRGELGTGGYEAWILLGETRNMDEREEAGLRALREGTRLAEEAGAAGEGMISLAISYTNEGFDRASHATLLRWLQSRFPSHPIPQPTLESLAQSSWHSRDTVTEALLNLARAQHASGIVDADTQVALGVLFYTAQEFDRARDCFEAALSQRPEDWLLWNRLGSSLSNGNKPEESLGAYQQALQLRPTYTRAIYNVGVACLNIGQHKEAAEHFLSALSLQESTGDKSEQLLNTLRRAFAQMGRPELVEKVVPGVSLDVFRKEGFDF